ncbi:hypothetical protein OPV22_004912 [Ensete ventricosum]|uniref:Uncharacterized protein n=1 Tax=Ensete ventricosum TaxID=4639 RepID=A0AAV8Q180_ENSVE|nr:hypothetical protein OPV22_004912 [Ensete ventricosum]
MWVPAAPALRVRVRWLIRRPALCWKIGGGRYPNSDAWRVDWRLRWLPPPAAAAKLVPWRGLAGGGDHHGPPKVNMWEDPLSPSKWKEEHVGEKIGAPDLPGCPSFPFIQSRLQ